MNQPIQAQTRLAMLIMPYRCLLFRAHSLGVCWQQLAVTASGWWMVYYTASFTLIHSSEGKPPGALACWGAAAAGQQTRRRQRGRGGAC